MNIKSIKAKITVCFCLLLVLLVFISYEGYFGPDKVLARNAQIDEMQSILQNELQARRYEKNMIIRRDVESKEKPDYHRDSASFSNRCGIGAVRIPALAKSVTIHSRLNR